MNDKARKAYELLIERSRLVATLSSVGSVLGWDQETYMPPEADRHRADQSALIGTLAHTKWTEPEVGEWLDVCEASGNWPDGSSEAANLREWRRTHDRARKLPEAFVGELARETSLSQQVWVEARKASDFERFAPALERVVALVRRIPEFVGYDELPYDALLDEHEQGARTSELIALFDALEPRLSQLAAEGEAASLARPGSLQDGPYPLAAQAAFNREVAEALGFDFSAGRVDTAVHPFCAGLGPRDVRLTTRYDEADFTNSLYSVLHETGHGLYEQGLDTMAFGTPCGMASSLGIHESQSRLWENHVARTPAFWSHWLSRAAHYFPQLAHADPVEIARYVNRCRRSFIRVDADELTYDLHVILRLRIEAAVINDGLPIREIPALWNDTFHRIFGLKVPDDARGCLQDVHWSHGSFGYFPTYTLGNLNAARLMQAARRAIPNLDHSLAAASYSPLLDWLRAHIHRHGQLFLPSDLIRHATHTPASPDSHLAHLEAKVAWLASA